MEEFNTIKTTDNKINKFIGRLAEDLELNIYKEYFEVEYDVHMINKALDTEKSRSLNIADIRPLIPSIIANPKLVAYLNKNNHVFKIVYHDHFITKKENFVNLTNEDSFALSWLMYLYH
jgi:hypothetical protein